MFGILKFGVEVLKTPIDIAADFANLGENRRTTRTGDRLRKAYQKLDD